MKRLLPLLLLVGCHNWEEALAQYEQNHRDSGQPVVAPSLADGQPCGADTDCDAGSCQVGVCTRQPSLGGECGDMSDCAGGSVCEPNFSNGVPTDYVCKTSASGCAPYGRLASMLDDCNDMMGGCTAAFDNGICRRLAMCQGVDAGCLQHSDCCPGSVCSARDAGVCVPGELGALPNGLPCNAPDQCATRHCRGSDVCDTPVTCTPVGTAGAMGCCAGTKNGMNVCLIGSGSPCQADAFCESGQCLAGRCKPKTINSVVVCRENQQLCIDDNDCCTGLCDAVKKQCMVTNVTLRDGGHCDVDIFTRSCATDGGFSCKTPRTTAGSSPECCSGSRDMTLGTCN